MEHRIRTLVTAFGPVPGANAHSACLLGMAAAIRGELDMVTVKTEALAHQTRLGDARLFRVRVTGTPEQRREAFARAVRRQLESQPYDIVHARGPHEGVAVAELRRSMGFTFVYEVATYPDEAEGRLAERAWATAHDKCLDAADLILVPTEAAARFLGDRGHAGKVAVVHPGVDVDTYDYWPGTPSEAGRLLYLGSFSADRDLGTVLGAIRLLSQERPIRAMLAGESSHDARDRLRRMVRAFGLEGSVQVRGEPMAVFIPALIAACDVGVVSASATPRFREHGDLPQPLLEYMACRRPIVTAAVPGLAEVARDEKEAVAYLPGDDLSLAEALRQLLAGGTTAARLVESAYDQARWRFSGAARRRRIAEVYEMLAPGSQSYDAWDEAFERESTGLLEMPSSMVELGSESSLVVSDPRFDAAPGEDTRPRYAGAVDALGTDPGVVQDGDPVGTDPGITSSDPGLEPLEGTGTSVIPPRPTDLPAVPTRVDTIPGIAVEPEDGYSEPSTGERTLPPE